MKAKFLLLGLLNLFALLSNPLFAFDSSDVEKVIAENSSNEIRHKLKNAQIMQRIGYPLAICGAISAPTGIILMSTADIRHWYLGNDGIQIDSDGPQAYIGLALIAAGVIEMSTGAICIVFGRKKALLYKDALAKINIAYDCKNKSYGIFYSVLF